MKNGLPYLLLLFSAHLSFAQDSESSRSIAIELATGWDNLHTEGSVMETGRQTYFSFPNLRVGIRLSQRHALLIQSTSVGYEKGEQKRSFETMMPCWQYWVSDRWWVMPSLGLALDYPSLLRGEKREKNNTFYGPAGGISTGYELFRIKKFVFDIQGKALYGNLLNSGKREQALSYALVVGGNWYLPIPSR